MNLYIRAEKHKCEKRVSVTLVMYPYIHSKGKNIFLKFRCFHKQVLFHCLGFVQFVV